MTLLEFIHDLPAIKDEARNLWGEELVCPDGGGGIWTHMNHYHCNIHDDCPAMPAWSYHFNKIIYSDNPLQYYKDNQPSKEKK